jgi:hypothetical protein
MFGVPPDDAHKLANKERPGAGFLPERLLNSVKPELYRLSPPLFFTTPEKHSDMEQHATGQRILDPIERAKLGVKVLNLPYSQAEVLIDEYVSGKNYDQSSVDYFKDQVATQIHIREKGAELLVTGGEIVKLIARSFMQNLPKGMDRH